MHSDQADHSDNPPSTGPERTMFVKFIQSTSPNILINKLLTWNVNNKGRRARLGRSAPVLYLHCQVVLVGCLLVQLARHPDNVNVSHGVESEVFVPVPVSDVDQSSALALHVRVNHRDDGHQVTNLGRLKNLSLLQALIWEVTELELGLVIILLLPANMSRSSIHVLFDPG